MARESDSAQEGDRVGDRALAAGVAAFVTAFIPGIGELISVPAAVLGVTLGLVGVRRFETGRAIRVAPAVAGTILSVGAGLIAALVLLASRVGP